MSPTKVYVYSQAKCGEIFTKFTDFKRHEAGHAEKTHDPSALTRHRKTKHGYVPSLRSGSRVAAPSASDKTLSPQPSVPSYQLHPHNQDPSLVFYDQVDTEDDFTMYSEPARTVDGWTEGCGSWGVIPATVVVFGSFADIPAVIRVDDAKCDSTVSLSFLHSCNVPRTVANSHGVVVESTLGPVRVPTVDGWYNSRQTFRPVYLSGCDVELGRDWLVSVSPKLDVDGSRFQKPSETDIGRLSGGHSWTSVPEDDSSLSTVTEGKNDSGSQPVAHGLPVHSNSSVEDLRQAISQHLGTGFCASVLSRMFEGCESFRSRVKEWTARRTLRKYIKSLQKAKSKSSNQTRTQAQFNDRENRHRQLAREWPQIPSSKLKHSLVQMFKDETSSEKLAMFTYLTNKMIGICQTIISMETVLFLNFHLQIRLIYYMI
ncbi:hypothetical protein BD769DRAFT_1647290 [Suillus cothurnatus]|nr:hypothetical protein BD769DRAFT_1647290 [Suillus cothurnatus]